MIISTKIVKALGAFADKDPLRSTLHGILFDPADKSFNVVATDGKVLLRTNGLSTYDDYEYPGYEGDTWMPSEPIHIGPEIFDVAKAVKTTKTGTQAANEILITGFNAAGKLNVVYNISMTASVSLVDAKYPDVNAILPKEDINYKHYFGRIYNVDDILRVAKACKDMGDKFVKFKFLADNMITVVSNHLHNFNLDYEILLTNANSVEESDEGKIKKNLILEYKHGESESVAHSDWLRDNTGDIYTANSARNHVTDTLYPAVCKEFYNSKPCYFAYRLVTEVNSVFNGDKIIFSGVNDTLVQPLYHTEEPLTPEEENALNELTDGPGSSDSAVVQQNACMQADDPKYLKANCSRCGLEFQNDKDNVLIQMNKITGEYVCINCASAELGNTKAAEKFTDDKDADDIMFDATYKVWKQIKEKYNEYITLIIHPNANKYITFSRDAVQSKNYISLSSEYHPIETDDGKTVCLIIDNIEDAIKKLIDQGFKVCRADNIDHIVTAEPDPYPNHNKRWTKEDEEKLEFLYKAGKSIEDLSEIFGRKPDGIEKRLEKLGLIDEWNKEAFEKLEFLFKAGKTIGDLSEIFSRSKDDSCGFGRPVPTNEIADKLAEIKLITEKDVCPACYKDLVMKGRYTCKSCTEAIDKAAEKSLREATSDIKKYNLIMEGFLLSSKFNSKSRPVHKCKLVDIMPEDNAKELWLNKAKPYGLDTDEEIRIYREDDPDNIFYINKKSCFVPEEDVSASAQWTAEDDEYLLSYYKDGCPVEELAEAVSKPVEFINERLTALGAFKKEEPKIPAGFIPLKHPIYCRVGKKIIDKGNTIRLIKAVQVGKGIIDENNNLIPFDNITHVTEK